MSAEGSLLWMVQPDPIIYREEVAAMLFSRADINVKLSRIVRILEDDDGQEEEDEDES